tara:strand:- start:368 stop:592 length:225 start_codon:yes stop_codon:yes gene_type:complete
MRTRLVNFPSQSVDGFLAALWFSRVGHHTGAIRLRLSRSGDDNLITKTPSNEINLRRVLILFRTGTCRSFPYFP